LVYFYNAIRPHFRKGMYQKPPLEVPARLGYNAAPTQAALAPVLLERISTDLTLACRTRGGNDLLARYIPQTMALEHTPQQLGCTSAIAPLHCQPVQFIAGENAVLIAVHCESDGRPV
jgi:hypothetical protein